MEWKRKSLEVWTLTERLLQLLKRSYLREIETFVMENNY